MHPTAARAGLALIGAALFAADARASRCELNGVEVNTDNGATTAGKSGILKCYRRDGKLQREQELRNGEYLGLDKRYDDDGSVSERQVNKNGNTEGLLREFYPNGKRKREATYENGASVRLSQSFFPDGRTASLSWFDKPGAQATVAIEYNQSGQLTELRCGPRSLIPADQALCGFEGRPVTVKLYGNRGEPRAQLTLREGKTVAASEFDRDGKLAEGFEATANGRIERRFYPSGQKASEFVVANDYRIGETEWYMNGQLKSKTTREPSERYPKTVIESYRDNGVLRLREYARGDRRERQETFDERGVKSEEFDYADEGQVQRHRKFAPDGTVTLDEEFYPDGSRKTNTAGAKISNQ